MPISKTPFRTVPTVVRCVALAAPLLLIGASPAEAASCVDARAALDVRLADLADQGAAPFVQYVHRTRMIYQLDVAEALDRVAAYRQKTAACMPVFDE